MDGPCEVNLIPRPRVKTITSATSTVVVNPSKAPGRQPVTACDRLRHLKWFLNTCFTASSGGAGDAPTQKHVEENQLKGCDPVLMEVHQLAKLQSRHYLHTGTTAHCEVLGLSWGLLAMLSKSHGMVSGSDIANLLLHKHLDSSELDACRAFESFAKGTTNLVSLLISGKTKETVEHARRQGAWHHALILKNLEKNGSSDCIMSRFIKNLDNSDLVKTYYYLVCVGEMPAAAPGCGVDGCSNWHLHLAIVVGICNTALRKEFVAKLAETLASKGLWHAAHFCQMVLQLDSDLLPKASLHSLVGEWMGLLAKMQKEITPTSPVASTQHPMDAEERKVPLSENHCKNLAGLLLPPAAYHVPKADNALVEVLQAAPVDAGKHQVPVDHGKKKVPLSGEDFRKLIRPLLPPPVSVPKDDKALADVQGSVCHTQLKSKPLKKDTKQSKKMSWLSRFSCFGSQTMD